LGLFQTIEKEHECFNIEKRERSGGSTSQRPIDVEALVIERIETTAEDLCRPHRKGQNEHEEHVYCQGVAPDGDTRNISHDRDLTRELCPE
jgi:hypothetical protein